MATRAAVKNKLARTEIPSTIFDTIPDALAVVDARNRIRAVNRGFCDLFRVSARDMEGKSFFGRGPGQQSSPMLRERLSGVVAKGTEISGLEMDRDFPGIGRRRLVVSARRIGRTQTILIVIRNATGDGAAVAQVHGRQVQALAARLLKVQEEERRRVSRELHDQICQQMASLAIEISGLAADPPPPERAQEVLRELQRRVIVASEATRHIAYELHPSVLDDLGLVASLRSLCKQFGEREGVRVQFASGALPAEIPRETASCLYRVAQEGLQNIARHSGAKRASVSIGAKKRAVALVITDDGSGFDPEDARGRGGLGLVGMEERTRLVKGRLSIKARKGHGTRIQVEVPLQAGTP